MKLTLLLTMPLFALVSACTPDRSLDTGSPHWAGEYRGGYTDEDTVVSGESHTPYTNSDPW